MDLKKCIKILMRGWFVHIDISGNLNEVLANIKSAIFFHLLHDACEFCEFWLNNTNNGSVIVDIN